MRSCLILIVLLLGLGAWGQEPARTGNPDRGQLLFTTYCASCHGEQGRGDGPAADRFARDLGVRPANLTTPEFQSSRTDAALARAIRDGSLAVHRSLYMPAWGVTLSESQIADLVAFIRQLGASLRPRE